MTAPLNGRVTVYTNQVPYEADVLRSNSYKMADVSKLAETILGTGIGNSKLVSGLPCLPIAPPGMQVTVGAGCMYSFENYDNTAYSVLPADTDPNHKLYKQALNFDLVVLDTPAPLVVGNSIIYLVQGAFETLDVNIISRPYFNSADPTSPIFNNLSDTRVDKILINVISGVEGPSPTPPTPTPGFVPLYYVTVAFGQTSIVTNNITLATGAPFVTESLTQKVSYSDIRSEKYTYFLDTGTTNAIVVTPSPAYANFDSGTTISVRVANTITGACTLSINGITSIPIKTINPAGISDPIAGQIISGGIYTFISDGSVAQLSNPSQSVLNSQIVSTSSNLIVTGTPPSRATNDIPPINTDGIQVLSLVITPLFSDSSLLFEAMVHVGMGGITGTGTLCMALYQDSIVNSIATTYFSFTVNSSGWDLPCSLQFTLNPPLIPGIPTTFHLRIMNDIGVSMTMNGNNGTRRGGGTLHSVLTIEERKN